MTFGFVPNDGMTLSCAVVTFLRPLTTTLAKSGIHRPVALHFERRVAFLVVVLSAVVLDRGRIAGAIGECKTCADNERPRGQHESHNNVSHLR